MSLYLKHRPKSFDEIIGNEHIKESLIEILKRERGDQPHVIMFEGSYGQGKSSFSRILAKELGCDTLDLREIDVGSNRSVEDADHLKSVVRVKPLNGDIKVYIIDEIQIATRGSYQESLLKTLEDGAPPFVYFILCTTDPQKINKGILSRSMRFTVSKLSPREILILINRVLEKEQKEIPTSVKRKIASKSEGTPRNALVMLDQIIDLTDEAKMGQIIDSYQTDEAKVNELCQALLQRKEWSYVSEILSKLNGDSEKLRNAVLKYCDKVRLNGNYVSRAAYIIDCFKDNTFYGGMPLFNNDCYYSLALKD